MSALNKTLLQGKLVRLTGSRPEDGQIMARWSEDAEYMRLVDSDWVRPSTAEQFAARTSPNGVEFRIRMLATDRLLGFIAVHSIEWNNRVGELSVGIGDPSYWGKGYGSETMLLAVRYAFHELNLNRLWLTVISYNERAIRLYKRAGFRQEGTLRSAVLRDGQSFDMLVFGILRAEWEAAAKMALGQDGA